MSYSLASGDLRQEQTDSIFVIYSRSLKVSTRDGLLGLAAFVVPQLSLRSLRWRLRGTEEAKVALR